MLVLLTRWSDNKNRIRTGVPLSKTQSFGISRERDLNGEPEPVLCVSLWYEYDGALDVGIEAQLLATNKLPAAWLTDNHGALVAS